MGKSEDKAGVRAYWRYPLYFCAIVLLLYFLGFNNDRTGSMDITVDEEQICVAGSDGASFCVKHGDVTSVTLTDTVDMGALVSGCEDKKECSGIWRNDAWGEYHLFVSPKLTRYLVVAGKDGVLVFNFESDESTEALYDGLYRLYQEQGRLSGVEFDSTVAA